MKLYWLKRILFSIFSLVVVILTVSFLIYNVMDRTTILGNDGPYNKKKYNEQTLRAYDLFEEYGYLEYSDFSFFLANKYEPIYGPDYGTSPEYEAAMEAINFNKGSSYLKNKDVQDFSSTYKAMGYTIELLPRVTSNAGQLLSPAYLIAKREKNPFERLGEFFVNLIRVETIWDVDDPNLTDRYVKLEWDQRSNMPALVGSGTYHKYLVYFDNKFPFVHQNIVHINLGKSSRGASKGIDTVEYMMLRTGYPEEVEQVYPADVETGKTTVTTVDFHSVTYVAGSYDTTKWTDNYTNYSELTSGLTRVGNSFLIGIVATIAAYIIGLPMGIWMSLKKDKVVDKVGNGYIIFIMAVPSLAYIFMFASIGTNLFNLPYKFAFARDSILPYILPTISLALPAAGGLMKWMRRFMVDQQNSDYVKFARSQGLSESEIFTKHIAKNAFIFLVHNVPADILGCLVGAIITERVYGVPGIGRMLTDAITGFNNGMIIGVTVLYTILTITSLILGDALLAKYDPRVSLDGKKG